MLDQPGDHACSEWNDQDCLVGVMTVGGSTPANWLCQATTAMCMVAVTRSSSLHNDAYLNWVQLFCSFLYYFTPQLCDGTKSMLPGV